MTFLTALAYSLSALCIRIANGWMQNSVGSEFNRWLLWLFVLSIPVPWLAVATGWFVAECRRQPWAIGEVLPTAIAASSLTATDLRISLTGFLVYYTILFIIEMFLIFKFERMGPSALHTGQYHHECPTGGTDARRLWRRRAGHGNPTSRTLKRKAAHHDFRLRNVAAWPLVHA